MEMVVERFEHGGDIYTHKGVLDFSASINPLGMPPASVEAIREHAAHFDVYPDREYRELRAALAEHVQRAVTEQTVEGIRVLYRMAGEIRTGAVLEK